MAIRDVFKFNRKTFVNPSGWFDIGQFTLLNNLIYSVLRNTFTKPKPEITESFEQAIERLGLTELDVKFGAANYRLYALAFFIIGLMSIFYSFYLLFFHHAYFGWVIGLCMSGLFFAQGFKYDFWSLQMRQRKLGITFKEWSEAIFGSKGK